MSALLLTIAVIVGRSGQGTLSITVFDVGQGQCVLLRCGEQCALVDCGGENGDADGEEIVRALQMRGIFSLDAVILTHYDKDHVCGVYQLLQRINVGELILPELDDENSVRDRLEYCAKAENITVSYVSRNLCCAFGAGRLQIYPPTDTKEKNASLSALMSVEEYDILVTGDMSADAETQLLLRYELPKLEVLVAGHHGSKYSTGKRLLEATRPEIVLISVGENTYGHPAPEVLERIASVGAKVYRTDRDGDITITGD